MYKSKNYGSRKELEDKIITDLGRTVDKKDATITGTVIELSTLGLKHGGVVWGVTVIANDYTPPVKSTIRRGRPTVGKLNGVK